MPQHDIGHHSCILLLLMRFPDFHALPAMASHEDGCIEVLVDSREVSAACHGLNTHCHAKTGQWPQEPGLLLENLN